MRDLSNRLHDYLTETILPRLASLLGSGWQTEGTALTAPDGQDFSVRLVFYTRKLIFERACDEEPQDEDRLAVAVDFFVPPETIAEVIKDELLPQCSRESDPSSSGCTAPAATDSASEPAAAVP